MVDFASIPFAMAKGDVAMKVCAWSEAEDPWLVFNRPCVGCGCKTTSFCDGVQDNCFAAGRMPSESWEPNQRTPYCRDCEVRDLLCPYCRGVAWCRHFTWSRTP